MELHKVNELVMNNISKKTSLALLLTLSLLAMGCTSNDLGKYRDNGLIPGETSTFAEVVLKAKVAAKERDEESLGNALDELADFVITTSPVWLPLVHSSTNN